MTIGKQDRVDVSFTMPKSTQTEEFGDLLADLARCIREGNDHLAALAYPELVNLPAEEARAKYRRFAASVLFARTPQTPAEAFRSRMKRLRGAE